ncbi:hypothetical protein MBLNU230_g0336t1 [Neophaeotheca triangularis]
MFTAKRIIWPFLGLIVVIALSTQLLFNTRDRLRHVEQLLPQPPPDSIHADDRSNNAGKRPPSKHTQTSDTWTYTPSRDADNPGLTSHQCTQAFPSLYKEIDRSVTAWSQNRNHTIQPADTSVSWRNDAALRLLIHNNKLRILQAKHTHEGYRSRTRATLSQINRALQGATVAGWRLPTIEFSIVVDDMALIPARDYKNPNITVWTYNRRDVDWERDRQWVVPDFNFWHTPAGGDWIDAGDKAAGKDAYFVDKIQKAVWRGAVWTLPEVREKLITQTRNKTWADVEEVDWKKGTYVMRSEDLCRYAFVVHTEGRSWSGRLKYLLNCDSVPIVHDLRFLTHYYHLLVPEGEGQNYIKVERDFSDLEEKVQYYLDRPEEAQRIADNAVRDFRERATTVAAEACYWRKLFEGWSRVAWTPDATEMVTVNVTGEGGGEVQEERLRGMPFGEFLLNDENYP